MKAKWSFERLGYVAGALFPVALFGGILLEERGRTYIDFQDGVIATDAVREFFSVGAVNRLGTSLAMIGTVCLVLFAGALYVRFTRISERARPAALGSVIGAAAFAILVTGAAGPDLVTQYDPARVDPAVLVSWYAGQELIFGMLLASFLGITAMLATTAYVGFTHRALPRWAAWPAAVLAVTMGFGAVAAPITWDIGFVAWLSFLAFMVWMVVVSLRLAVRPQDVFPARDRSKAAPPAVAPATG